MITETDLKISNKSYINKDFPVVYKEILDLAKKLSYIYDPESSNETDPFIVLLKIASFVTDKTIYNTDVSVLENTLPSASQLESVRTLCAMNGYDMNYYIAPTTTVTFKYTGDGFTEHSSSYFTIPKFSELTNSSSDISYITLNDCTISSKGKVFGPIGVIQGELNTLTVLNDDTTITLENLDDNRRIYFPVQQVAQNGVYISGGTIGDEWERTTNLNLEELNSNVYKFGFDSSNNLPYIEFPSDIANIIGDGLTIQYVITSGESGNVKAKALTKLSKPYSTIYWNGTTEEVVLTNEDETSNLVITNSTASVNGANIEGIDSGYNNFKKTVGTYETLVTCRDYLNKIYNLVDSNGFNLVSNVQVSDRRTDINKTTSIVTRDIYGSYNKNITTMDAHSLRLYPFKAFNTNSVDGFNQSFTILPSTDLKNVKLELEDSKSISQDYEDNATTDIYAIKNYYTLTAIISTNVKVTETERLEIIDNVYSSLVTNFNARKVDFGYEIPFDSLLKAIENADERIKSVSLYEPEITSKVLVGNYNSNNEIELYNTSDTTNYNLYLNFLAKNILAGKVALFDYNDDFDYDYGQKKISGTAMVTDNIKSATTLASISFSTDTDYELKSNEAVKYIAPSLITKVTYPYGINYHLKLSNSKTQIDSNTEYQLQEDEVCVFVYNNNSDTQVVKIYTSGSILKPNTNLLVTTDESASYLHKVIENQSDISALGTAGVTLHNTNELYCKQLSTNDQVEYREFNVEYIKENKYWYWLMNNSANEINWSDNNDYLLQDGEYVFQTDANFTTLYSYGSGNVIRKTGTFSNAWSCDKLTLTDIDEEGLLKHKDKFKYINCDTTNFITIEEQTIYSFNTGDKIKYTFTGTINALDNDFEEVPSTVTNISYTLSDGTTGTIEKINYTKNGSAVKWKARSYLDINAGPSLPQTLFANQSIVFTDTSEDTLSLDNGDTFRLSVLKQLNGGEDIDLTTINYLVQEDDEDRIVYEQVYAYEIGSNKASNRDADNFDTITIDATTTSKTYDMPNLANKTIITIFANYTSTDEPKITVSTGGEISFFEDNTSGSYLELKKGMNTIVVRNADSITISKESSGGGTFMIGKPSFTTDTGSIGTAYVFSSALNLSGEYTSARLLSTLTTLDSNNIFYVNNPIDNNTAINVTNMNDPYALFDVDNVYNKWTICQIDFKNSNGKIDIARGCRK